MITKWQKQTGQYQNGEWYVVGKIIVGSAFYSGGRGRDDPLKYAVDCKLPGIKACSDYFATIGEAKARLERMVAAWFKWTSEE